MRNPCFATMNFQMNSSKDHLQMTILHNRAAKKSCLNALLKLKDELNKAAALVSTRSGKGKTKHPGLHYFTAREWLQFADMHMRHHLRQKKRIEEFLTGLPD